MGTDGISRTPHAVAVQCRRLVVEQAPLSDESTEGRCRGWKASKGPSEAGSRDDVPLVGRQAFTGGRGRWRGGSSTTAVYRAKRSLE